MATMPSQIKRLYEFGPFRLDPQKRLLFHGTHPVPLTPKAIETLVVLVENRARVLLKDDLMKRLWPDSFVEESNLSQNIFLLRRALGDSAQERRYILTVPGRGYQFTEAVQEVGEQEEQEALVVESHTGSQIVVRQSMGVRPGFEWGGAMICRKWDKDNRHCLEGSPTERNLARDLQLTESLLPPSSKNSATEGKKYKPRSSFTSSLQRLAG
jgi:DNA-binding winged helix-turn-helix (wHTH) protein